MKSTGGNNFGVEDTRYKSKVRAASLSPNKEPLPQPQALSLMMGNCILKRFIENIIFRDNGGYENEDQGQRAITL